MNRRSNLYYFQILQCGHEMKSGWSTSLFTVETIRGYLKGTKCCWFYIYAFRIKQLRWQSVISFVEADYAIILAFSFTNNDSRLVSNSQLHLILISFGYITCSVLFYRRNIIFLWKCVHGLKHSPIVSSHR